MLYGLINAQVPLELFIFLIKIFIAFIHLFGCEESGGCVGPTAHVWRSENNLQESVLLFFHVNYRDHIWAIRHDGKAPLPVVLGLKASITMLDTHPHPLHTHNTHILFLNRVLPCRPG